MVAAVSTQVNLVAASNQWASRPNDERFATHIDLLNFLGRRREQSKEFDVDLSGMSAEESDGELKLRIGGQSLGMTNWGFNQVCSNAGAPASYLSSLPPHLAAQCLNQTMLTGYSDSEGRVLVDTTGSRVRALTSRSYGRVWDYDLAARTHDLTGKGWKVPPARPASRNAPGAREATAADCLGSSLVKPGDIIAPAGLYAGDRDMFIFMVNEDRRLDDGSDGGMSRGFFLTNSEVGRRALTITSFMYRYVCGNHIVWDAKGVSQVCLRHVGRDLDSRAVSRFRVSLREYADASDANDRLVLQRAKSLTFGATREEVVDVLFGKRVASRRLLDQAYTTCEQSEPSLNPRSAWGMVQGLTRLSQEDMAFADARADVDAAAGKVMKLV
jgi:hypothetical protein